MARSSQRRRGPAVVEGEYTVLGDVEEVLVVKQALDMDKPDAHGIWIIRVVYHLLVRADLRSGNVDGGQGPEQTVTSRYHKGDGTPTWGAAGESAATG